MQKLIGLVNSLLHCRIGSSETADPLAAQVRSLHCRIGSSEKWERYFLMNLDLHCRIGSSEKHHGDEYGNRQLHCHLCNQSSRFDSPFSGHKKTGVTPGSLEPYAAVLAGKQGGRSGWLASSPPRQGSPCQGSVRRQAARKVRPVGHRPFQLSGQ